MTAAACAVDDRVETGLEPVGAVVARVIEALATVTVNPAQAAGLALLAIALRHEAAHEG